MRDFNDLDGFVDQEDLSSQLYPWENLITFKPSKFIRDDLWRRTHGGVFQFIEDGWGELSCDLYPVKIRKLPVIAGKRATPERFLRHVRLNINAFIDRRNTRFRPYGFDAASRRTNTLFWKARHPDRAVMHLDLINLKGDSIGVDLEDATVVVTSSSDTHWTFSTAFTPKFWQAGNGTHPINGNREFRIQQTSEGYSFYSRAADRVNGFMEYAANFADLVPVLRVVARGQDHLWRSLQAKVAAFINANGGAATVRKPTLQRFAWDEVRKLLNAHYCTVELEDSESRRSGCIRVSGPNGKLYRIRRGDTLLGVAGRAYGVGPGQSRLRLAQMINDHPYNQRFWRAEGKSSAFPKGRISFNPRFSCNPLAQTRARTGPAPFGRCYATILLPPKPP